MSLYYIATGTTIYANAAPDLPDVESDVMAIASALECLGYQKAEANPPLNPSPEDLNRLGEWFQTRQPEDDVVLYYVGHGNNDDQHYLLLSRGAQFASLDLVRTFALRPHARRILLVLDTCESGSASLDLGEKWKLFEDRFRKTQAHLTLVTSCRSRGEAFTGTFTPALAKALRNEEERYGGLNQEHLFLRDLLRLDLPASQVTSLDSFPTTFNGEPDWDFPNPRFNSKMPLDLDLEAQRRFLERAVHWDDRIRYFTGRAQALEDIEAFLARERGGAMVVTGDPGCGKSSVLAHFVLAPGKIDLPIHAKGRDLKQIMEIVSVATTIQLAPPAAGGDEARAKALAKAIGDRGQPISIAIDALDEAVRPAEITRSLLSGLATAPGVWLLIGTRPDSTKPGEPRFQGLGSTAWEIDLDSSPYFVADDLESYARTRLREAGPYRVNENLVRSAARAVAGKAGRTFLVAKLECDGLVKSERVLAPEEIWQSGLPVDIKTAFREYLGRFAAGQALRIENVLRPLAFAFGQGLPVALWELLAPPDEIRATLAEAGAYVTESLEDKRSVYRLFHEKFAEFFRERTEAADEHSRIVSALTPPAWLAAPAYTRRYLALHAAAASRLDELIESPAFLVAAEPETLRRVVAQGKSDCAVRNGNVYSVAVHLLGEDLGERAANLALAAMKFGYRDLAEEFRNVRSGSRWWIRATQWKNLSPHFVIRTEHGSVRAVAVGQRDGVAVIASSGDDSRVRLWNLETLQPVGKPLELGKESIRVEQLAIYDSTLLTVTDGALDAWDLETLETSQCPWGDGRVLALSAPSGRCLAISDDSSLLAVRKVPEGELVRPAFPLGEISIYSHYAVGERAGGLFLLSGVQVLDLASLKEVGKLSESSCNAVGTGMYNGRPAIVTGTSKGDIRIWDSESLLPMAGPLQGHETYVDAVALGERSGQSVAISGSRDGTVRVWNPARPDREKSVSAAHTSAVWALTLGKNIVVSSSWDGSIRVWNMETLEPTGAPIRVNSSAAAVGELRGRPVIFSGGEKGVSLWDVETQQAIGVRFGNPVCALALGTREGRLVVLGGSGDGSILVWDAETSKPAGNPLQAIPSNISMGVNALAVSGEAGQQRILAAGAAAALQAWDLETLQPAGPAMKGHRAVIYALAAGVLRGKPVAATVSFDQTVRVWDLEAFQQLGDPLEGHESHVYAVAIAEWNGQRVIFSGGRDGTLRVWDLETHAQISVIHLDSWIYSLQVRGNLVFAGCANGLAAIELR